MKTFKRLLLFLLLLFIVSLAVGYFYGLRPDNYQVFLSNLSSRFFSRQDTSALNGDTLKSVTKHSVSNKKKKQKPFSKKEKIDYQALPINPFASIDKHVKNCPKSEEKSVESLAAYLRQNTTSDLEMARSIYIWLTHNIRYDDAAYNSKRYGDYSAEGVLKSRKAICEGFSNLFYALGKQMNLTIEKVVGYAKGYGYEVGQKFTDTDHAWNLIKINGQWRVFDATWGEGNGKSVKGKLVSKKEFNNYWFNVNPYEAIFSHLPENKNFLNVKPEIDLKAYESLPYIETEYFEIGFDGANTYHSVYNNRSLQFPVCYPISTHVKITVAPKYQSLEINKEYDFEFYIPRGESMAIIDSKNTWTYFEMDKGKFKLRYAPTISGDLTINIKHEKGGSSFHTILSYIVKNSNVNI